MLVFWEGNSHLNEGLIRDSLPEMECHPRGWLASWVAGVRSKVWRKIPY